MMIPAKLAQFIAKRSGIDEQSEKYDSIKYALETWYMETWKTILLFWLAVVFGIWQELLLYFVVYGVLRRYSCGLHLNNEFYCALLGVSIHLGFSYLSKITVMPLGTSIITYAVVFILFFIYAPAGTQYIPVGKSRAKLLKMKTLIFLTVLYIVALTSGGGVKNAVIYGSISQVFNVLPITYRLFNEGRPKDYVKSD